MSLWQQFKARFMRNAHQELAVSTTPIMGQQSVWAQFTRIGGNLTPSDVSNIVLQADGGDPSRLVDLANDSRQKDGSLHGILSTRENALSALPMTIPPIVERGEREPTDQNAEVAAFVEDAFKGAVGDGQDIRSTDDLIPHLQGGVYHGFSNAEIAWERRGRLLLPSGFRLNNQRRFKFRWEDGRLVWSDRSAGNPRFAVSGSGAAAGVDLMAEFPGQFIQHMPRVNGDVAVREGLSHLLVWPAVFRNWDLVDWLRLAEMAWKPWRIGKMTGMTGDKDRANLINALERLTTNGVALIGKDQEIDLRWPGQEGGGSTRSTHKELADWLGAEMAKAVLGQTLTSDTGEGGGGAYALGKVHNEVRKDIRDQDAKAVAATLRRDFVKPLVWLNFGDVPIPEVVFQTEDAPDLSTFATALTTLQSAGFRIPEHWAYDVTGVPMPQEDDAVLKSAAETAAENEVEIDTSDLDEDEKDEPPNDAQENESEDDGDE